MPPKNELSDRELLEGIASDDYGAFTALYERYVKNLTYYGLKFTSDQQIVEDALHDLFVWIWNKRKELSIQHSLKSYLIKSVRTTVLQKVAKGRRQLPLEDDEDAYHFQLSPSTEEYFIDTEQNQLLKEKVNDLLTRLTAKQKEVIYLRFYEGLSFEEIARNMDLSVKACYKLMGRAVAELRKTLPHSWLTLLLFLK